VEEADVATPKRRAVTILVNGAEWLDLDARAREASLTIPAYVRTACGWAAWLTRGTEMAGRTSSARRPNLALERRSITIAVTGEEHEQLAGDARIDHRRGMRIAIEREHPVRRRVVNNRVGVFGRWNLGQLLERLQIEHDHGFVVAGGGKSVARRGGDRGAVRSINAAYFANHGSLVFVHHHHSILAGDVQAMTRRVGHYIIPAAVAAERVRMGNVIRSP
jgi:hypothetical protein